MTDPKQMAFPGTTIEYNHHLGKVRVHNQGMSKREYMATTILAGMCGYNGGDFNDDLKREVIAVRIADRLIEELNRKKEGGCE